MRIRGIKGIFGEIWKSRASLWGNTGGQLWDLGRFRCGSHQFPANQTAAIPSREEPARWHWCYWCCHLFCCRCGPRRADPLAMLLEGLPRRRHGLWRRPRRAAIAADRGCPERHREHGRSARRVRCGAGGAGPSFHIRSVPGAMAAGPLSGWAGGLTLLAVIFMPAVLVLVGVLPFWESLSHRKDLQASILQASTPGSSGSCWQRCTTRCGRVRSMTDGMSRWRWLRSGYWSSRVHRRSWWCCWLPWRVGRWRGSQGICQSI